MIRRRAVASVRKSGGGNPNGTYDDQRSRVLDLAHAHGDTLADPGPDRTAVPLGLSAFQGRFSANLPLIFATPSIATIPPLLDCIVLQRRLTESLAGFAKG